MQRILWGLLLAFVWPLSVALELPRASAPQKTTPARTTPAVAASKDPRRRRQLLVDLPLHTAGAALLGIGTLDIPSLPAAAATPSFSSSSSFIRLPRSRDVDLPRVGYSLYKTKPEQVAEGVGLALQAGVRHFDCASQYQSNAQVGNVLRRYIQTGQVETRNGLTIDDTAATKQQRQAEIFVTHKVSNSEQSLSTQQLQRNVLQQTKLLGLDGIKNGKQSTKPPLDLVMLHSPLTDRNRRISSYGALCDLQDRGKIGAVGVCHFGVTPLQELVEAGLPPPSVIQLELSPFHQHLEIAEWAQTHNCVLSCSAWSRLSSTSGPTQGWDTLSQKVAAPRQMTKQQVLIRWAVQKGYLCVPRSSSQFKVERQAIQENSWDATKDLVLTEQDVALLDGLDERITAGQLGVVDGWEMQDVDATNPNAWDPTTCV